jgi:hypothetical protein
MSSRTSTSVRGGAIAAIAAAVALTALTLTRPAPAQAVAQPTSTTAPAPPPASGFLLSRGRFTVVDPPGSVRTKTSGHQQPGPDPVQDPERRRHTRRRHAGP